MLTSICSDYESDYLFVQLIIAERTKSILINKSFYWGLKNIFMIFYLNYKCIWFVQHFSYWWFLNTNNKKGFIRSFVPHEYFSVYIIFYSTLPGELRNHQVIFFTMTHGKKNTKKNTDFFLRRWRIKIRFPSRLLSLNHHHLYQSYHHQKKRNYQ